MEEIKFGRADYAVLPIENSTAGIVQDNYDLLTKYDHVIVGEQIIRCQHVLTALPGATLSDIRTVYSHPQALMQCREFLEPTKNGIRRNGAIPLRRLKKYLKNMICHRQPSQAVMLPSILD